MKTKSTNMELVKFEKSSSVFTKTYSVIHNNGNTCLEQKIHLSMDDFGNFDLNVEMDGFPRIDDETDALLKYGDWLERLGVTIRREAKRAVKRGAQ